MQSAYDRDLDRNPANFQPLLSTAWTIGWGAPFRVTLAFLWAWLLRCNLGKLQVSGIFRDIAGPPWRSVVMSCRVGWRPRARRAATFDVGAGPGDHTRAWWLS